MKKYVKPELFYEHFELSTHIAACDYDHNNTNTDTNNCAFTNDWGDSLFMATTELCTYNGSDLAGGGGICYYTGGSETSPVNLFNS